MVTLLLLTLCIISWLLEYLLLQRLYDKVALDSQYQNYRDAIQAQVELMSNIEDRQSRLCSQIQSYLLDDLSVRLYLSQTDPLSHWIRRAGQSVFQRRGMTFYDRYF